MVKPWFSGSDSFLGYWGSSRSCLTPIKSLKLHLMLDRAISHSVLHLFKKGHLCLSLGLECMDQLGFISERLTDKLNNLVEQGYEAITGLNFPQALQNCKDYLKASTIKTCVFGEIDLCFATVGSEANQPGLANTNLVLSDDLNLLFIADDNETIEEQ